MKKYKVLKVIWLCSWVNNKVWDYLDIHNSYITLDNWFDIDLDFLIQEWYIEEFQEEVKPKFKIGQEVRYEWAYSKVKWLYYNKSYEAFYYIINYIAIDVNEKWIEEITQKEREMYFI